MKDIPVFVEWAAVFDCGIHQVVHVPVLVPLQSPFICNRGRRNLFYKRMWRRQGLISGTTAYEADVLLTQLPRPVGS